MVRDLDPKAKTTPEEIQQLTDMLNSHAEQTAAVNRLFDELWAPVRKEQPGGGGRRAGRTARRR